MRVRSVYTRVGYDGSRGRRDVTLIGASIKRVEDYRLLTGGGRFVADLRRPGAVSAVIVRSPHAHARIVRVDTGAAQAHPGVFACLTFFFLVPATTEIYTLSLHGALPISVTS